MATAVLRALVLASTLAAIDGRGGKGRTESSSKDRELTKECPWMLDSPQWQNSIRPVVEQIEGLDCTRKPDGQLKRLGHLDNAAILEVTKTISEEKWFENDMRQRRFPPHKHTQSILLVWNKNIFTGHLDPTLGGAITSEWWPAFEPHVRPLMKLIQKGYGMRQPMVWKAMLARLPAGKSISEHSDASPVLNFPHRIHWVIKSNDKVETLVAVKPGDTPTPISNISEGDVFELNNVHRHSVHNHGDDGRVHLIIDVYPHSLKDQGVEAEADGIDLLGASVSDEL